MSETEPSSALESWAGPLRLTSDERLVRRATKGDRRAFAAIYRRYHQDLYRYCTAILGNSQDAQDALQNAMVKALRALPGEKRRIQLKPWLYRIAHNEAIELLRRRRPSEEIDPETAAAGSGLTEIAEQRERLRGLLADIAELPARQRGALVMRELAGLSFAQIGLAFETSAAAARQIVYEARLNLRQMKEGREMSCKEVTWVLSEADGRATRRRDIQAHLRTCRECRAFRDEIAGRSRDLSVLAPLPLAASAGLLQGILGGGHSLAGGGLAGTLGAGAGKAVATSAIVKSAATVAVVAAVGVTTADRTGLIQVGNPDDDGAQVQRASRPGPAGPPPPAVREAARRKVAADRQRSREDQARADRQEQADGRRGNGAPSRGESASESAPAAGPAKNGRPHGLPAASSHGQETAAANGRGSRSQPHSHPEHPPQSHSGSHSSKGAHSPPPHSPPAGKVGPDKAQHVPFQSPQPPTTKGTAPEQRAHPSKERR